MRGRRAGILAVLLVALVAGCTGGGSGSGSEGLLGQAQGGSSTAAPTTSPAPAARVSISPRSGTDGYSVVKPVVVTAAAGTLSSVTVRNADGEPLRGALNTARTTWTSAEPLGYDRTYSVSAVAANADGKQTRATSRFTTVQPRTFTLPYLSPSPGSVVGVGQPIAVRFDEPIADRAAAERALTVTTTPAVQGSWHWFSDQLVHWRPPTYWRPGTRVTVEAAVYGVHVGDDVYGQQDVSMSFTIGRSKIATIDDNTKQMVVRIDGKVVRKIPVAMGKDEQVVVDGKTINYLTQSGPHIVAEKYAVKTMSSASYGVTDKEHPEYYEEKIPLAVRISPDGEFVHAAPWSVADQGRRNVSHGCVNISPDNARWFYKTFSFGDVVDIRNTGRLLPQAPGYNEWGIPWSQWKAGSALS
ncbi:MAG TPA: Ig-like domain-containing protein [Mycobacteriales bacterium]|nr:Ig-like domain-containing protein [Mycobacteriales bacterium]